MPSERQRNEKNDDSGTESEGDRLNWNSRSDKMEYATRLKDEFSLERKNLKKNAL